MQISKLNRSASISPAARLRNEWVEGLKFGVPGFGVWGLGFGVWGLGFRWFKVQCLQFGGLRGNSKHSVVVKPPWAEDVIKHRGCVAKLVARPGKVLQWACHCKRAFFASNSAQLSVMRQNHKNRAHDNARNEVPPLFWSEQAGLRVVKLKGLMMTSAWECAKCHKGLPGNLSTVARRTKAAKEHIAVCQGPKATLRANSVLRHQQKLCLAKNPRMHAEAGMSGKAAVLATVRQGHRHAFAPVFLPLQESRCQREQAEAGQLDVQELSPTLDRAQKQAHDRRCCERRPSSGLSGAAFAPRRLSPLLRRAA